MLPDGLNCLAEYFWLYPNLRSILLKRNHPCLSHITQFDCKIPPRFKLPLRHFFLHVSGIMRLVCTVICLPDRIAFTLVLILFSDAGFATGLVLSSGCGILTIVAVCPVTSPLSSPLFKKLKFKEEDGRADEIKTQALTKPQVAKLIAYCEAEPTHAAPKFRERIRMNRLGIHLDIYLGLRFGELFGLRWSDIREDTESGLTTLQVSGQRLPNGEWVNFTKKHTDEGLRTLVLIPEAVAVLNKLRAMNLDDTYVFLWSKTAYANFQRECKRA